MTSTAFYVYEHTRNDTGAVFYVGKGSRWRSGITQHRSRYWKNVVSKAGGFTHNKIVNGVDEDLAFLVEIERIDQLRRLGIKLVNLTDGGEGASNPSEETRRKMSESKIGSKNGRFNQNSRRQRLSRKEFVPKEVMSENMRKNHWSKTGVYTPVKGVKFSEETKEKLRQAHAARPLKECPHCGYMGKSVTLIRWHGNNCKMKGVENGKK